MRSFVALVLLALLASGCSGEDPPAPEPPRPAETRGTESVEPPPPAQTEAEVLERVHAGVEAARAEEPIPDATAPSVQTLKADYSRGSADCRAFYPNGSNWRLCARGDVEGEKTLVVIGDSHARQWGSPIDILAERAGYRTYHLVRLGCPAADITPWLNKGDGPNVACEQFHAWSVSQVLELKPDVVVLATSFNPNGYYVDGEQVLDEDERLSLLREAMVRLVRKLDPVVGRFVVIGDPPAVQRSPVKCLLRAKTLDRCAAYGADLSLAAIEAVRAAAADVGATYVETAPWFCLLNYCPTVLGTMLPYRDQNHVSDTYARYLVEVIGQHLALDSVGS